MTPRRPPDPIEEVLGALEQILGTRPTDSQEQLFGQYLELFGRWNRVHRMTALGTPTAIVRDLFIDSLLFLRVLPPQRPLAVVDIGAGAGIPGLPMRLADPRLTICLVESKRKRVSFLRTVCRELGLDDVAVIEGRAEQIHLLNTDLEGAFDVAVSRAVARMDRISPIALPYLKVGGAVIVATAPDTPASPGAELIRVAVPGSARRRGFLMLTK